MERYYFSELPNDLKFGLIVAHRVNQIQKDFKSPKIDINTVLHKMAYLSKYLKNSVQQYNIGKWTTVGMIANYVSKALSLYYQSFDLDRCLDSQIRYYTRQGAKRGSAKEFALQSSEEKESYKNSKKTLNEELLELGRTLQGNIIESLIMY